MRAETARDSDDGRTEAATLFDRMNQYVGNRLQRWLWRKGGCTQALWETWTREVLRECFGLYRLPTTAAWKRAGA